MQDHIDTAAVALRRLTRQLVKAPCIAGMGFWRWLPPRTVEWSTEIHRMFGVDPSRNIMTLDSMLDRLHPDDRTDTAQAFAGLARRTAHFDIAFRISGEGGAVRHCRCRAARVLDAEGNIVVIHGVVQDVTDDMRNEAVQRRTEMHEATGRLAGILAHDFNNLLTVMSVNLEIAREMIGETHAASELLQFALRAASGGADLTASMFALSRPATSRLFATNVNALLTDISTRAGTTLDARHTLVLKLQPDLQTCQLDPEQFEIALLHLVTNSRDAMPEGGVITLSSSIEIAAGGAGRAATALVVTVTDTGIGIPLAQQDNVFEPFFTTKTGASGLGLSTVMAYTRQSGGHVEMDSRPGYGTMMRLFLPV